MNNSKPPLRSPELQRIHAERQSQIIATVLQECPDPIPTHCLKLLRHAPESFDDLRYGAVAAAAFKLHLNQRPITILSVQQEIALSPAAARADLTEVFNFLSLRPMPLPAGILEWECEELWNAYSFRRKATLYDEAARAITANPSQAGAIDRMARKTLEDLDAESNTKNGVLTLRQANDILSLQLGDHDRILGDRMLALGQSLVIAGPASVGKSRMVYQLLASIISEHQFLSFETRRPDLRWLLLQAENSNRRLQSDLRPIRDWLSESEWARFHDQVVIHTIETDSDSFLSLDSPENQKHIEDAITHSKCDGVIWDSLYNFGIGDLNKDTDMATTCLAISRLSKAKNPERPIIVLHHAITGKAGASKATGYDRLSFARNSKVLLAWSRAQINLSPGTPDSNSTVVISCGKCSNGQEFPTFAVTLDPKTMLYSVDPNFSLENWKDDVRGKSSKDPLISPSEIKEICVFSGMTKFDLSKAIQIDCGCSVPSSYRYIKKAAKSKAISFRKSDKLYFPT
jgi:hypothetical protein